MNLHYTLTNKALIITDSTARATRPPSQETQSPPARSRHCRSPLCSPKSRGGQSSCYQVDW